MTPFPLEFKAPVLAYCNLDRFRQPGESLEDLRAFCRESPFESDLLAEESNRDGSMGPFWNYVVEQVENSECMQVVVPSLRHLACGNYVQITNFFKLLERTGIRLRTANGLIDSQRQSFEEISELLFSGLA